jgi:hypothetical protein
LTYHKSMRRFIFILMIALLPLRGWMGEAMATTMAADEIAINLIADKAINTSTSIDSPLENDTSNCDMHKLAPVDDSSSQSSCTACQACNAAGTMTSTVQTISIIKVHNAQPQAFTSHFASASIALGQKPPIL